jgi:hypothetical protein
VLGDLMRRGWINYLSCRRMGIEWSLRKRFGEGWRIVVWFIRKNRKKD